MTHTCRPRATVTLFVLPCQLSCRTLCLGQHAQSAKPSVARRLEGGPIVTRAVSRASEQQSVLETIASRGNATVRSLSKDPSSEYKREGSREGNLPLLTTNPFAFHPRLLTESIPSSAPLTFLANGFIHRLVFRHDPLARRRDVIVDTG
jgi:hypothetical protein